MSEPNTATSTDNAASLAATAEQPANAAPMFTAEQVAERERVAAQKAHDAAEAAARRRYEEKLKEASAARQGQGQQPAASSNATGSARAYERAVAAFDFPDEALTLLDEEFDRVKPSDPRQWVEQRAAAFRIPKRGATATPTTPVTNPAPEAPNRTAITMPTTPPPAAPALDGGLPPLFRELPEAARDDALHAYVRSKGGNPSNPHDPKTRAAHRDLRNQFEAEAARTSVVVGARR